MKKVLFLILCAATVMLAGCSLSQNEKNDGQSDSSVYLEDDDYIDFQEPVKSSPQTYMEMFEGERKLWYYLDRPVAHNTSVPMVLVTRNGMVEEVYYKSQMNEEAAKLLNESVYGECFIMSDFSGKTDDEILSMVRAEYASLSNSYGFVCRDKYYEIPSQTLPYKITYSAKLDSSGNNTKRQEIHLFDNYIEIQALGIGVHIPNDFSIDENVMPTSVKEKEYVGFSGTRGLVTLNIYDTYNPKYDSPDGAIETW